MSTSVTWTENRKSPPGRAVVALLFRFLAPKDFRFQLVRRRPRRVRRRMDPRVGRSVGRTATPSERRFRGLRRSRVSSTRRSVDAGTSRTVGRRPSTPSTTDATARRRTSAAGRSERGHWLIWIQPTIRTFASCRCRRRPGKNLSRV